MYNMYNILRSYHNATADNIDADGGAVQHAAGFTDLGKWTVPSTTGRTFNMADSNSVLHVWQIVAFYSGSTSLL